jgi:NAD(P)-dependent dehydrogenase (short-subunit alcohol dehydrogenase family)
MKIAFISGASSGIGRTSALILDALGWRVYGASLPGDDVQQLIERTSAEFVPLSLDITDTDAVQQMAERIRQEVGVLHGVVNNAGIQIPGAIEGLSLEALRRQFEVNVFGHVRVTQALLPYLRKADNGRLVFVTSIMGRVAMPALGAYSMTKHALEGLVDVLRLELAPDNIHVAAVQPGAVQTPLLDAMPRLMQNARQATPDALQRRYAALYDSMDEVLSTQADNPTPVGDVAEAIVHALTSASPKTRYGVGLPNRGLMLMRRLAPDTAGDAILRRILNLPDTPKS